MSQIKPYRRLDRYYSYMTLPQSLTRTLSILAFCAAALLAVAPVITQAQQDTASSWTELCTNNGLVRIPAGASDYGNALPADSQGMHSDCSYCPLQAGTIPTIASVAPTPPKHDLRPVGLESATPPYLPNTNRPLLGSRGPPFLA